MLLLVAIQNSIVTMQFGILRKIELDSPMLAH